MAKQAQKTITKAERLRLIGLLALAEKCSAAMRDIHEAAGDLLGEPQTDALMSHFHGHISDAIYDDSRRSADKLLKLLGVKVIR